MAPLVLLRRYEYINILSTDASWGQILCRGVVQNVSRLPLQAPLFDREAAGADEFPGATGPGEDALLLTHWGRVDLGGRPPRSPTDPDLRLIKPPLSQCLIPDPGRMDIGDRDLKTDNLLHDDVCSADLHERESANELPQSASFPPIGPDDPQTSRRDLPRANPAANRSYGQLVHWHLSCAGQVRQPPLVAIELPGPDPPMGCSLQRDKSFRTDVLV